MRTHRAQRGRTFWLLLAVVVYVIASAAIAVSTSDECGQRSQTWVFAPPHWECESHLPGRG